MTKPSRPVATPSGSAQFHAPLETQQFGVSLQFIKENNGGDPVPPVVRQVGPGGARTQLAPTAGVGYAEGVI